MSKESCKELPLYAILLKDISGFKEDFGYGQLFTPIKIAKGSLILRLKPSDFTATKEVQNCNYKVYHPSNSNSKVYLFADPGSIFGLSGLQRDFVLGVNHLTDRLATLEKLEWIELLKIDSEVFVTIATIPVPVRGIVRFIGGLPGEYGRKFGIELMEKRGQGTTDGMFKGFKIFDCNKDCAVFVSMDKLTINETVNAANVTGSPQTLTMDGLPVRLGDIVSFYTKYNHKLSGTVRWIGTDKSVQPDNTLIIGIEAEKLINDSVIPDNLTKLKHCFTATDSSNSKVFLPVTHIIRGTSPLLKNTSEEHEDAMAHQDDDNLSGTKDSPVGNKDIHSKSKSNSGRRSGKRMNLQSHTPYNFVVGSEVLYEEKRAVIKWIGVLPGHENLSAGVEMDQPTANATDGAWEGKRYFGSHPGRGKFVPLQSLQPDQRLKLNLMKEEQPPCIVNTAAASSPKQRQNIQKFERESMIEYGNPPQYGVIKWIGNLPGHDELYAGVDMDEVVFGYNDGMWAGVKYFDPQPGRGIFIRLSELRMDERFALKPPPDIEFNRAHEISAHSDDDKGFVTHPQCLTTPENQIKQSQQSILQHEDGDQITTAVNIPHHNTVEMARKIETIEEMVKLNMESIQRMEALDVQKRTEQLTEDNSRLQNQLSIVRKSNNDLQTTVTDLLNQLSHTQNQLSISQIQLLGLQKSNNILESQLSLTKQQLFGVQSMMILGRLWVVSRNQFTIGEEIGRGAWATVHKATFRGATVAAKCLHDVLISPKTTELFQREMEMSLHCQHQNIATFLGATMEGAPVILMELMDVNLRKAYEQGHILDHQIHGILHDVGKALHFLHTRTDPVIHRDVSSSNVLLKVLYNGEWLAKVGDLGTANIQQRTATAGPGAIAYGSPEARNPEEHTTKMDVYSFGVLILETLTKTHPFQMVDTLKAQVQQQYPQYDQLVTSCTKQQSSDRPTMYDVLVQLDEIAAAKC